MDFFAQWPFFFIALAVATTAMATGIGGALFFSPILLLGYALEPALAFTLSIFIEIFGFGSGLIAYGREGLIDYTLGRKLLLIVIPGVLVGVLLSAFLPGQLLSLLFALFLAGIGTVMLFSPRDKVIKHPGFQPACKRWRRGEIHYWLPKRLPYGMAAIGGLLVGLFSSGVGEVNDYLFLQRMRMHAALAAGTSVLIVAVAALTAVVARATLLLDVGTVLDESVPFLVAAIPGVLIGGQLGMRLARRIASPAVMRTIVGTLFLLSGIFLAAGSF